MATSYNTPLQTGVFPRSYVPYRTQNINLVNRGLQNYLSGLPEGYQTPYLSPSNTGNPNFGINDINRQLQSYASAPYLSAPGAPGPNYDISDFNDQLQAFAAAQNPEYTNIPIEGGGGSGVGNFWDFALTDPSILASTDLGSNLYGLGRAIGYNPNGRNISNPGAARTARTLSIIGHGGASLLQGAQSVLSGIATQKRRSQTLENIYDEFIRTQYGADQYLKNGGPVKKMATGGEVVELERGEFIRDPEGNVAEVAGRTHEQGGERFALQVGTEVTSDNRRIGKSGVKKFEDMFPSLKLKLSATDTYADVVRKAESKIGLKKLNEEISTTNKRLESLDVNDVTTYQMNDRFLRNKLDSLDQERQILEASRLKVLDAVFDAQEASKGKRTNNTDVIQAFANGGTISDNQLKIIQRKTGYPESYLKQYIKRLQDSSVRKLADGDTIYYQQVLNSFAQPEYGQQHLFDLPVEGAVSGFAGVQDSFTNRVMETFRIFPQSVQYFDIQRDDQGNVTDIKFKDKNSVKQYQEYVNRVYDNLEKYADANIPNEQQRESLKEYVSGLRFDTTDNESVRFTDNIFGEFTSSRSGIGLPLVTKQELDNLNNRGITNFSQLFSPEGALGDYGLSESTIAGLNTIRDDYGNDFEALLLANDQRSAVESTIKPETSVQAAQEPDNNQINNLADLQGFNAGYGGSDFTLPYLPNQYRYDFDSPTEHLMQTPSYGRLTATRRSPNGMINELYRAFDTGRGTLNGFADSQRLSNVSQLVAGTQNAVNQALAEVEAWNSVNQQTVDQFNIGQGDREEDRRLAERRLFEELSLTALAKTDKNNEIINNHNRRVRLGNFDTVNRLRTINDLNPNYNVTPFGQVTFDQGSAQPLYAPLVQGQTLYSAEQAELAQQAYINEQARRQRRTYNGRR